MHKSVMVVAVFLMVSCVHFFANGGDIGEKYISDGSLTAVFRAWTYGGRGELPGIIKVEFPYRAFDDAVDVTLTAAPMDRPNIDDYEVSGEMFNAGPSSEQLIKIHVPNQPKKSAFINLVVSQSFLRRIGSDFKPKLFVKYFEEGADNERIDTFEINKANVSNETISAALPPSAFTNMRYKEENIFEAIVVLGSVRKMIRSGAGEMTLSTP